MELKLEIIGKEVIKASSSSSLSHELLQLSLFDCNVPPTYVSSIFFYKVKDLKDTISQKLKNSLSKTLSRFYPLTGLIEGVSINCNNEGAVYTEAYTDLLLDDYLKNLDINSLNEFFPKPASGESAGAWPLLSVQANFFGSRSGVALAVCVSHKLCDASSLSTFVRDWASTAKGESNDDITTPPQFVGTTIFPPAQEVFQPPTYDALGSKGNSITNRFVFESSKIMELKRMAASENVPVPTRVEVISSLIWKCAANASRYNLVTPISSGMAQAMDLRPMIPSTILSKTAMGNLLMVFLVKRDVSSEFEICEIVAKFRKTKEDINKMIEENLEANDTTTFGLKLLDRFGVIMSEFNPKMDFSLSSWCRKGFYEVDFGWGRPSWVTSGNFVVPDDQVYAMLMDANDGEGIEAWISLGEEEMLALVHDQEFVSYASLNPPIII